MGRRVVPLTGDLVECLPEPCRRCLYWERGEARPEDPPPTADATDDEAPLVRKQAWVSTQVQEGRPPGRIVRVDDELAAWVTFAPTGALAARGAPAPRGSADALQLATLWVQPHLRGHGLGRLLLQAAVREALRTDLAAVEAYGDRRWRERGCLLPATWLLREGFVVHREAPRVPLLRLEVRRTARWAESLEGALEEILGRLPRPVRAPEHVPRTVRRQATTGVEGLPTRNEATASVNASASRRW